MSVRRLHQPKLRLSQDLPHKKKRRRIEGKTNGKSLCGHVYSSALSIQFYSRRTNTSTNLALRILYAVRCLGKRRKRKRKDQWENVRRASERWCSASERGEASVAISTRRCSHRAEALLLLILFWARETPNLVLPTG